MTLTPRDIDRMRFPARPFGWARQDVREFLRELAAALETARAKNEDLHRRLAELEASPRAPEPAPQPAARTAEISRAEAQGIIREAEEQALQIVAASRAELLQLRERITILEAKQESVLRKLRQFLHAELEIVRTIEESGAPGDPPAASARTPGMTNDIEDILRSLESP
jgi:cell division initiation protein